MVEDGHIEVQVCPDGGDILFRVTDNGVGMSAEQVDASCRTIRQPHRHRHQKRQRPAADLFCKEYGLRIHSVPDEGTCVEIRMPR